MTDDSLTELRLTPMGCTLRVISNSAAVLAAAEASFGRFGGAPEKATADFTFRLFQHSGESGPPGPPVFRREEGLLVQTTGRDNTLVAHLPTGEALGYFSPTVLADAPFFRWYFLELAFYQMLETRGWMGVHASALAQNGRALLLRAASGGGKTTLAFAGARSGRFKALAEDVVWLSPNGEECWGAPWHFHLLPAAAALFPELVGLPPLLQTSGEMKLEVDLEKIRSGSTVTHAQIAALIFVERRPGHRASLEAIDPNEAQTLWPAAQTGLENTLPHHAAHLERLLRRPIYRLVNGNNLDEALDLLTTALR